MMKFLSTTLFCFVINVGFCQSFSGHYGEIYDENGIQKDRGLFLTQTGSDYSGYFYVANSDGTGEVKSVLGNLTIDATTKVISFDLNYEHYMGTFTSQCENKFVLEFHSNLHWYLFPNRGCNP